MDDQRCPLEEGQAGAAEATAAATLEETAGNTAPGWACHPDLALILGAPRAGEASCKEPLSPSASSALVPKAASWEVYNYPALKNTQCLCIPAFERVGGQSFSCQLLKSWEVRMGGRGGARWLGAGIEDLLGLYSLGESRPSPRCQHYQWPPPHLQASPSVPCSSALCDSFTTD